MLKKVIENTIFVALLIILGISVSPALPFKNIPRTYVVVSGSMEPTIKTGSIVLTNPVDPKTLKTGDIVAFTSPSNSKDVILHRISGIKSESPLRFQTKGDNNNAPDAWDVMDVGVLGKQVYAVPYIGHIAAFVRKPLGFGLIIVFPALIFIISQILNIKKYIKEEIDKQVKSKTLPMLFFFLSMFSVSSLFFTGNAIATLSSIATISGVTFSTKDFAPPSTPVLNTPADGITVRPLGLTMDWTDVSDYANHNDPVYYIYELSTLVDFSTLSYQSGHLSDSQISATGTPNGTYYWRVKACDAVDNCSSWSSVRNIIFNSTYLSVPQNLTFKNPDVSCGGYTNSSIITVDWDDVTNATKYSYQVKFNGVLALSTTFVPSQNRGSFGRGPGLYSVRVASKDNVGNTSSWTSECDVTYDNTKPTSSLGDIPPNTNSSTLSIGYTATDNYAVDYTKLCYSFNDPIGTYTCDTNFNFTFSQGEGTYYFYSLATDRAGNIESVPSPLSYDKAVTYDITPPTTVLILNPGITTFSGQNLLPANNWSFTGNYLSVGSSIQLGVGDSDSVDTLFQTITLPTKVSANLSFAYNFTTLDTAEYDYFSVGISSSTGITNLFNFGGSNSGWQTITRSIAHFAGTTFDLFFRLVNSDPTFTSSVLIDNINVSPLDLRTGDTSPVTFLATDLGSGIDSSPAPADMSVGDTQITVSSTDLAGNAQVAHSISIVTLPPRGLKQNYFINCNPIQ